MNNKSQQIILFFLAAFFCLSISQLSSYLINSHLAIGESYRIADFLYFTHVRNHGGIFGSFHGKGWVFAIFSIFILSALIIYVIRSKSLKLYEYICFGIILGAGGSNILDRFIYGSVVDFINVQGIPYWHYVFNTADTFIHIGIWPMLLLSLLDAREEHSARES